MIADTSIFQSRQELKGALTRWPALKRLAPLDIEKRFDKRNAYECSALPCSNIARPALTMTLRTILARAALAMGLLLGWGGALLAAYILWELVSLLDETRGRAERSLGSAASSDA